MIDPNNVPEVADSELLARFILNSNERREDGTVNHKLFLPYSWTELSVNRHRDATLAETWQVGAKVAVERKKTLHGLANIRACKCYVESLRVVAAPILPGNPNHAALVGYPQAKEDQMAIAKELAASIEGRWIEPPLPS